MIYTGRTSTVLFGALMASLAGGVVAQTGDSMCNQYLCVTAILNGSTTTFEVLVPGSADTFGWVGTGFGTQMPNSPLVVLWPNDDGSITLSQRMATDYVMPTVVPNPPRVATIDMGLSALGASQTRMVYTIPSDPSSTTQNLLWSMSATRPPSSAVDAQLIQHYTQGTYQLDLSKPLSALSPSLTSSFPAAAPTTSPSSSPETPNTPTTSGPTPDDEAPFTPADQRIVIHAVLCSVAFAVLLPLGSLFARYTRTFFKDWFLVHWVVNFWIALPLAVSGFAYGIHLVNDSGVEHFNTPHTRAGLALFIIAAVQWIMGFAIHYVKPSGGWSRRPPQNYVHAILGLATIALAFYTVYEGFTNQWPLITGRVAPHGMLILWAVWVGVISFAYIVGFGFLPRQYRQEGERNTKSIATEPEMAGLPREA